MAYDQESADRVRKAFAEAGADPVEKKMFGGLAFMVDGHMSVGLLGDQLMVRVGRKAQEDALAQPHARPMDFTGRPMATMVYVDPAGFEDDGDLDRWIQRGLDFCGSLPPK